MGKQQEIFMKRSALFPDGNEDSRWRYHLGRYWEDNGKIALWVMLNPSTADANEDDPTIRKCIGFSKLWGMGGCEVVNLFGLRSPYPKILREHPDPVGRDNDVVIFSAVQRARLVVCAWGKNGSFKNRADTTLETIKIIMEPDRPMYLRMNKDGSPEHPLYIPYSTELKRYA